MTTISWDMDATKNTMRFVPYSQARMFESSNTTPLLVTGRKARSVLYEACSAPWKISGLAESEKSRSLFLDQRETSEETAKETALGVAGVSDGKCVYYTCLYIYSVYSISQSGVEILYIEGLRLH